MTSPAANSSDLDAIVSRTRHLLLDFDGPICSVFAGLPAHIIADRLRKLLGDHTQLPAGIARTPDPIEVFTYAATISTDLAARVEAEMTGQELAAVATAAPTPYVHDVVTACQNSGRSVSIVSNNSARAVHAYLTRHGLDDRISSCGRTDQSRPRSAQAQPAPDHPGSRGTRRRARRMHTGRRFRDRRPGRPPRQCPQHRLRQRTRPTRTPERSRRRRHHQQPRRPGSQIPRTRSRSGAVTTFSTIYKQRR